MFTGLSAFPLTPITASGLDEQGFSNGVLGLTDTDCLPRPFAAVVGKRYCGYCPCDKCAGAEVTQPKDRQSGLISAARMLPTG